jgi:hypothetical protein
MGLPGQAVQLGLQFLELCSVDLRGEFPVQVDPVQDRYGGTPHTVGFRAGLGWRFGCALACSAQGVEHQPAGG